VTGFDACRQIRLLPGGPAMTVVACTGWGQPEDRRKSEEAGFDHHWVKPLNPAVLSQLLETLAAKALPQA
jgi:CheY-like chemotaxis protein